MLEMKEYCSVPFPDKLFEGYEVNGNVIRANINASKVLDMMKCFIQNHNEPLFFILELPCKMEDGMTEQKILINVNDDYDVYYMDGLDETHACRILDILGELLVKDGLNTFGFGGHETQEEILFGKYNVMTIFSKNEKSYSSFFESFGIPKTEHLVTAWDTFDAFHGGECSRCIAEKTGKSIYDIPDAFKDYGMYFYESRKRNEEADREITFADLMGKVLLAGLTYYTKDNELIEQRQFHGIVTEANELVIRVRQKDGSEFALPPDLSSTKRGMKGEYKLRSTGEIVKDPDFIATWNIIRNT